jgi:hypothetical protein
MTRMPPTQKDLARMQRMLKSQRHLIDKLELIRELYTEVYGSPIPIEKAAVEFVYAVGDILEGEKIESLNFKYINKARVLEGLTKE